MNQHDAAYEYKRLEKTVRVIEDHLEKEKNNLVKYVDKARQIQLDLTEQVRMVPNDLGSLTELWQFQTFMDSMERDYNVIKSKVDKLNRLKDTPYFARIDFRESDMDAPEQIYIGLSNLTDDDAREILIYDWRAPVSGMFYDYETGPAEYNSPLGPVRGELTLKRQFKIVNQKIVYMFDSSLKIDDEILQEILSQSADDKMKTIVASIQREQNKVIRNDTNRVLIVQGPAGSGKTSIALHRAAYLLYKHRDYIKSDNILILSPNNLFSNYISNVLPELGEDNIKEDTFYGYFSRFSPDLRVESVFEQMDYVLNNKNDLDRINNIKYKSSHEFIEVLDRFVEKINSGELDLFHDIYYKNNLIMSADEMKKIFREDSILPFKNRLEILRQRILRYLSVYESKRLDEIRKKLSERDEYMSSREINIKAQSMLDAEFADVRSQIDAICSVECHQLYEQVAGTMCREGEYFLYEDWVALVYMQVMLGYIGKDTAIKHLIIDEAQDYTLLQYKILRKVFGSARITVLGDISQVINHYMNIKSYDLIAQAFTGMNTLNVLLRKSYRSTRQIAVFCKNIIDDPYDTEFFNREGTAPILKEFDNGADMAKAIVDDVINLKEDGVDFCAIICRTASQARNIYYNLKNNLDVKLVTKEDNIYKKGIIIIPSYLSKGLEFDAVLAVAEDNDYYPEDERNLFYTVCTRAMHKLNLYMMRARIAEECRKWLQDVRNG